MASVSKHFVARHGIAVGATPTTIVDSSGNATLGTLSASSLSAALNLNSHALTNANIDSGNIDGVTIATSNVTVGAGKTLDVSAGTLTLANDQISGDKIHGGTISGPVTLSTPYISTIYAQSGTGGAMTLRSNSTDTTTGYISVPMTTASSSSTTGALVVSGGLGVAGNIYSGGNITGGTFYGSLSGTASAATNISGGAAFNLPYQTSAGATTFLTPNITTTRKFLHMTGTGAVGLAPTWDTVTKTDVGLSAVENTALSTWTGTSAITTLGTITSGTWNATVLTGTYGGTGVNNGTKTITLGGNLTTSGAFNTTLTVTALTAVTLPTTGTLATLAGSEALTNKTVNGLTPTALVTGFSIAGGSTTSKTLTVSNSITLAGTDATTITLPATTGTVALDNQTMYIGTTQVAINRASASLALTGITSIDGTAANVTGTVAVANGGTGAVSLSGILKGNGTSAFSAIVSGTDIKTINGTSLLGAGDISIQTVGSSLYSFYNLGGF